jgi:hypothetical protein
MSLTLEFAFALGFHSIQATIIYQKFNNLHQYDIS